MIIIFILVNKTSIAITCNTIKIEKRINVSGGGRRRRRRTRVTNTVYATGSLGGNQRSTVGDWSTFPPVAGPSILEPHLYHPGRKAKSIGNGDYIFLLGSRVVEVQRAKYVQMFPPNVGAGTNLPPIATAFFDFHQHVASAVSDAATAAIAADVRVRPRLLVTVTAAPTRREVPLLLLMVQLLLLEVVHQVLLQGRRVGLEGGRRDLLELRFQPTHEDILDAIRSSGDLG